MLEFLHMCYGHTMTKAAMDDVWLFFVSRVNDLKELKDETELAQESVHRMRKYRIDLNEALPAMSQKQIMIEEDGSRTEKQSYRKPKSGQTIIYCETSVQVRSLYSIESE